MLKCGNLKLANALRADDVGRLSLAFCPVEQDLGRFVLAELDQASALLTDTVIDDGVG